MKKGTTMRKRKIFQEIVAGVDEAGRGPLAGPVVAAAVCFLDETKIRAVGNFDSKTLSAQAREDIYEILTAHHLVVFGFSVVEHAVIDKINIFQATRLAMKQAVDCLQKKLAAKGRTLGSVIIDGNALLDMDISQKAVVKADAKIFSCMAASIIAKVTRDRLMLEYHERYPQYGFDSNKGYGTKIHMESLALHGPCEIHRRSFEPVRMSQSNS